MKKLTHLLKNQKLRAFFYLYAFILITALTIAALTFRNEIHTGRETYYDGFIMELNYARDSFAQDINNSVNACYAIFSTRWYGHYRNAANFYADEFHGLHRIDIQNEIASKVSSLSYIQDILVVMPGPDERVICKYGWYSFKDYARIFNTAEIYYADNDYTALPVIVPGSGSEGAFILPDITQRYLQGCIVLLVDKKQFAQTAAQVFPKNDAFVHVELAGNTLYEAGYLTDKSIVFTAEAAGVALILDYAPPRYEDAALPAVINKYILIFIGVIISGAVCSFLLNFIILQPLKRLVRRIGGNYRVVDDPYVYVENTFTFLINENEKLSEEYKHLNHSMERFAAQLRNEILFKILTDPDTDLNSEYIRASVPWLNEGLFVFLAVLERSIFKSDSAKTGFEAACADSYRNCVFSALTGDYCALLWYTEKKTAETHLKAVNDWLGREAGTYLYGLSGVLERPEELHTAFITIKSRLEQKNAGDVLPVALQIKLLDGIIKADYKKCTAVLDDIKTKEKPENVYRFITSTAEEYGADRAVSDRSGYTGGPDNKCDWDAIGRIVENICFHVEHSRETGMNKTAEFIRRFIDENYADPDICMKQLAVRFSIHRTLISKMFKARFGEVFTDYLQNLRLEKAVSLINETAMNLYTIAEKSGYANYVTFKRAFFKKYGVSPNEYRMNRLPGTVKT